MKYLGIVKRQDRNLTMPDTFQKAATNHTYEAIQLNQTAEDGHTGFVTLSKAKGLAIRFFAPLLMNKSVVRTAHATSLFLRGSISAPRYGVLRMTGMSGRVVKCINVMSFDLGSDILLLAVPLD